MTDAAPHPDFDAEIRSDAELAASSFDDPGLRRRLACIYPAAPAPAALRDRVVGLLAAESGRPRPASPAPSERGRLRRFLAGPRRANLGAVVATLALVAAAILLGIYGRPIDQQARPHQGFMVYDAAVWMSGEHQRCAKDADARSMKFCWHSPDEVVSGLEGNCGICTGHCIDLSDLGYRFLGGGPAGDALPWPAGHVAFARDAVGDRGSAMASVYFVRDKDQFDDTVPDLDREGWARLVGLPGRFANEVLVAVHGDLLVFVVCCDPTDLEALGADVARQVCGNCR